MPVRRAAKRDRPIGGVLPDRSIAIIHELVAVVLEAPAEVVQHRPGNMTSRATETVFSGKGWNGVSGGNGQDEKNKRELQLAQEIPPKRGHRVTPSAELQNLNWDRYCSCHGIAKGL